MKWIGQHIWDYVSRFRNDVHIEGEGYKLEITNTTTSGTGQGGKIHLISDDGAALGDDHQLGKIAFWGAEDASSTVREGASIRAFADAAWSASENGTRLEFYTMDGNNTSELSLKLDSDLQAHFTGGVTLGGTLTVDNVAIENIQTSGESFTDNDVILMTAAAIADKIEAYGYSTTAGDITGVTAGTGLSGGGSSGAVTLNLDISGLSEVTPADGDTILTLDSDGTTEQRSSVADLATKYAGTGLTASSSEINVDAAQSGVTSLGTLTSLAVTGASDLGGSSMTLTHQDVDQIALDINASNTTANILDINAQALTTGVGLYIDCNNLTSHANGGALHIDVDESSTTGVQNTLAHINYDRTGDLGSGQANTTVGLDISMNDLATGNHTTSNSRLTALDINLDHANANALIAQQIGIDLTLTDADTGYVGTTLATVGIKSTVEDGGFDIVMQSSADTGDHCTIHTTGNGQTYIHTHDDDGTAAHFEIAADGDITLDSAGQIKLEPVAGNNILLDGTVTVDGGAIGGLASLTSSADLNIVATGNDITVDTDTFTLESSTADSPTVVIKNTTADNQGARLQMKKDRGAAMVQGDRVGEIDFIGEDADQNTQQYGKILTRADVVTGGQESGKMVLQVASHDGDLENAFILIGGDEDGEVDATVGLGANSVVTIPGNIDLAGDIDVDGTLETDALTVGGVAFTPSTTKQVTHHTISDDIDSDVVFISLGEIDAETTSAGNKHLPIIAPAAGKLLKIFCRTSADQSSETFTWKLYTRTVSQSTNGTVAEIGAQSGAGPTNKTMVTYDFTTGLDSGTNAIAAGDKVQISIEASDGGTANSNYFITCLWEWDLS